MLPGPVRLLTLAAAALPLTGCWSYQSVIAEFDSVAGYEGAREPDTLEYRGHASRFPWAIRQFDGMGVVSPLGRLFSFQRERMAVDDPSGFARVRIEQLAAVAGNDLEKLCEAAARLLLVIEKDGHALNRAIAVEVLGKLTEVFRAKPLTPDEPGLVLDTDAPQVFKRRSVGLVKVLDSAWPARGSKARTPAKRDAFATALRDLSALDPGSLALERSRLRAVNEAMLDERDKGVRDFTVRDLLRCLHSSTARGLAAGVRDEDAHVRETAVRRIWRLGRAAMLPWLIAELGARTRRSPPSGKQLTIDPDVDVRRRLVHLAWSLDLASAAKAHGSGKSALAFLVDTASHDPESALQLAAREALAFLVRRPVDPTGAWIREWWQNFVTRRNNNG